MKDISLVVFDLDGTLIDAYPAIYHSFNFAMRAAGYPPQKERVICRAVGWGDQNLIRPFVKPEDLERVLAVYRRDHAKSLKQRARLFPGVRRLLETLKRRGYRLAVASNRPTRFSLILLRHLDIRGFFDMVLCGDKVKKGKPDPEILRVIMARFKVKPGQTVYVGDMFIDVQTAVRAGCHPVAVTTGSSTRAELKAQRPEAILPAARCLTQLLT